MLVLSPAKQDEGPTETESHFRALDAEDNETGFFFDSCFVIEMFVLEKNYYKVSYYKVVIGISVIEKTYYKVSYYKTVLNFSALRPLHTFFE